MSAICGIIHLNGAPVEKPALERMTAAIAYRGPDGIGRWQSGEAALAHLRFITTPESALETQPLQDLDGNVILVADARIDNRDELIAFLGTKGLIQHTEASKITDCEIILAAYRLWGETCPEHLVGDFAFAIYLPFERRLFLARDAVGVRQLVYFHDSDRIIFGTSLAALLAVLPDPGLNREFLEEWVVGIFDRGIDETPYASIRRLPPSCSLSVSPESLQIRRYWTFGDGPGVHYRRDSQYIDHFRHLFIEVIRAQLRSTNPVAIMSSGGLDSSAIACVVDREIAAGRVSTRTRGFAMVFPGIKNADESQHLDILESACSSFKFTHIDCSDDWVMKQTPEKSSFPHEDLDLGVIMWHGELQLYQKSRSLGHRVLLSGVYGDQVLGQDVYHRPGMLRSMPVVRWPTELPHFKKASQRAGWKVLAHASIGTDRLERIRRQFLSYATHQHQLHTPLSSTSKLLNLAPPAQLNQIASASYASVHEGLSTVRLLSLDSWSAHLRIEQRMPYLDRRLIEFILHTPPQVLVRDGYSRSILRSALVGILPEPIRLRTSKAHFTDLLRRGLLENEREKITTMMSNSYLAREGVLDKEVWKQVWEGYRKAPDLQHFSLLWPIAAEMWARNNQSV